MHVDPVLLDHTTAFCENQWCFAVSDKTVGPAVGLKSHLWLRFF